jgi:hypothetical protein
MLAGCGVSTTPATLTPSAGVALQGRVRGGQQPVVGAHVYLFAANTTGNGGPGIAASSSNASLSLLNSSSTGHSDSVGAYVLTDANGAFSITGDYTCTSGQQVYLYALGGNPGAGTNSYSGFLAALGNCPVAGNFAGAVPYIWMNEISTVAAAYAFAGYATDATHVSSSGTALALTGIANAFATAANLANIATGNPLTTTPGGNGTVPSATIITLANILATCVNSADQSFMGQPARSSACVNLLNANYSNGAQGYAALDTATAAIFMAHNPAHNVSYLYGLPGSNLAFGTGLTSAPNDFSLTLIFTGGLAAGRYLAVDGSGSIRVADGASNKIVTFSPSGAVASTVTNSCLNGPDPVTIDASGDLWTVSNNGANGVLCEFNASGSLMASHSIPAYGYLIAIDTSGNLWVPSTNGSNSNNLNKLNSTGSSITTYTNGGLYQPTYAAIDGSSNVWVSNSNSTLSKFNNSTPDSNSPFTVSGFSNLRGLAVDPSNNLWGVNASFTIAESTSAGVAASGAPFNTGSSLLGKDIAIDGLGQVWALGDLFNPFGTSTYSLIGLNSSGASITGSTGLVPPGTPYTMAIDGSGNLWLAASTQLEEVVGLAAPVVTPVVANLLSPYSAPASRP